MSRAGAPRAQAPRIRVLGGGVKQSSSILAVGINLHEVLLLSKSHAFGFEVEASKKQSASSF